MHTPQDLSPQTAGNLQQRIEELAGLMSRAAESLHQGEPVKLQHVADEINSLQTTVQGLSKQFEEHPLLADSEKKVTRASDIIELCKVIDTRQQSLDQLKRLQLVKSYDQDDQESFTQLQHHLEAIFHSLTAGTIEQRQEATQNITSEDSPIRALYELINRPEEMSDDRWMIAQRLITDSFGRNVALAIIRGRAR